MLQIAIIVLCVLPSLSALELNYCTLNRLPSLYEQYCCVEDNHGKAFILSDDQKQYIFCLPETPASCSSVNVFTSCSAVKTYRPTATSGYYNIMLANGTVITGVYCDMEGVNCDGEGGWMRVGYLNMSDPSEQCPPGFRLYEENGIRACGRHYTGCQSVELSPHNMNYTRVCGKVTGYQKGSPDAFSTNANKTTGQRGNIELAYVDGVSITRGSPRKHIWTYAASPRENARFCPCDEGSILTTPSFVGEDYFCESARESTFDNLIFYTNDLLWDGEQCGTIQAACCEASLNMPWFKKVLDVPSADFIELRVCGDKFPLDNEDVGVNYYEIFVK